MSNQESLSVSAILNSLEAGDIITLQFEYLEEAEACKRNLLSRAYKQRSAMRQALVMEFDSISATITELVDLGIFELKLSLSIKEPVRYLCTVIKAAKEKEKEKEETSNG